MFVKPGDSVRFACFYQSSSTGLGVSGLTVYVSVNRGTTNAVTVASNTAASALDATNMPGWYYYDYTVPDGYYGILTAYFTTADTSVSQRGAGSFYVSAQWVVYAAQQYRDANTVTIAANAVTAAALASDAAAEIAAGISVPSASTIADAVLDEALSGHATSGTVGAALTAIKTKTDLIGAGDAVTVNSPVSTPQNIAITQGDDYLAADGREITLPFDGAPDLTGAVVVIRIEDSLTNFVGMYTSTSTTDDTATFQPSKTASAGNTATGALTTGVHNCEIEATLSGGAVWTLTRIEDGKLTVYRQANTS